MKKYLFWVLAISILFGWYSFAAPEPDPCLTLVSPSIWWWTCSLLPAKDKEACAKDAATASSSDPKNSCSSRYSCETLFTNATTANTCNFKRCENQRGKWSSYCTCKYGANGDWIDKWIPLNTSIPFLWNCLKKSGWGENDTAALNAFPTIVSVATRILVTVIMLVWFIMIIVGGIEWASWSADKAGQWKARIKKVAIWFALLWAMWAILRLINPNFFK